MGSFYLVNVILAIVAMAYDDCRKQDALEADEEEQVCTGCGQSLNLYRMVQKTCTTFIAPSFCNHVQYHAVFTKMLKD